MRGRATIVVEIHAGRQADRGSGESRCARCAGRAQASSRRLPLPARAVGSACHRSRATRSPSRSRRPMDRSRRSGRRLRAARGRPSAPRVGSSAFSTAVPPCRQGLDQLALASFDLVDRAGAREVRRRAQRSRRRSTVGQARPARRCRPACTCPSPARRPRAPAQAAAGSAAGRSRCSRWPRCAARSSARTSTSAICSLVDVLASEPVTPTTSWSKRLRHSAAACWSATSASPTLTIETSSETVRLSTSCVTTSAAAPRCAASTRNRWPSVRSPGSAKKALPGSTRRESTAPPRIGSLPRRATVPPTAACEGRQRSKWTGAGAADPICQGGEFSHECCLGPVRSRRASFEL